MSDFVTNRILRDPAVGLRRPRRVRRFLLVSMYLIIALASIWTLYGIQAKHYALVAADAALIVIACAGVFLIRRGHVAISIHGLLISLLAWIFAMAWFISGSGVHNNGAVHYWLFVLIIGVHFVLFDTARVIQTFYLSSAILIFVVIEYNLLPFEPKYGFPAHDTLFGHGLTLGLVMIAIVVMLRTYIRDLAEAEESARIANDRSEQLLQSVLPPSIVEKVRKQGTTFTESIDECSVLFADIVGFTPMAARLSAEELVGRLNAVFSRFDELTTLHGVEKIKTIGDGYMAVCGIPEPRRDHAERAVRLGLDMLNVIDEFEDLSVRIGINSGPVLAGIIGQTRIAFDLWGETVNLASRMESHGLNDRVQISESTRILMGEHCDIEQIREIDVKGKGLTVAYILKRAS